MNNRSCANRANTQSRKAGMPVIAYSMVILLVIRKQVAGGMNVSKYKNNVTILDGVAFDSAKEARRYAELRLLERAGQIQNLQRQVPYTLIPKQVRDGKVIERPCVYKADFVYTENGEDVVEDTKGVKTKEYIIKRKLMLWEYGIQIREV